jgi:hypothetical protein
MKYLVLIIGLFLGPKALACNFDIDCDIGSKCVKTGYDLKGVCVGNRYTPDPPKDRDPYKPKWNLDKKGQSCSYDIQCGFSGKCLRTGGSLYGVCT